MAKNSVKLELEFTLPKIGGVLNTVTMEVLEQFGEDAVKEAKTDWTGWAYGRQYSPALKYYGKPGTSRDAWKYETFFTKPPYRVDVLNQAKDPRSKKGYSFYVHRVNDDPDRLEDREWFKVKQKILKNVAPKAVALFRESLLDNMQKQTTTRRYDLTEPGDVDVNRDLNLEL